MAAPLYQVMPYLKYKKVHIYSSNYQLYGDMSHRVMTCLEQFSPEIDVYSIDESFINLSGFEHKNLINYSREIKDKIEQWTGIPVAVGLGSNKVLAKLANHIAKKHKGDGVFQLDKLENETALMKQLPLDEIWGIGRSSVEKFKVYGIETVWDFYSSDILLVKQLMGTMGQQIHCALHNQHNPSFESEVTLKKSIGSSRSFSTLVTSFIPLGQALANYVMIASQKLRKQGSYAQAMQVYLSTNPFRVNTPQYHNSYTITFPNPTNDSAKLIRVAKYVLKKLYKSGYAYHKVGVMLLDLTSNSQTDLFEKTSNPQREKLMSTLDDINHKMGKNSVFMAAQGIKKHWFEKRDYLSQHYTTNWNELMKVN